MRKAYPDDLTDKEWKQIRTRSRGGGKKFYKTIPIKT